VLSVGTVTPDPVSGVGCQILMVYVHRLDAPLMSAADTISHNAEAEYCGALTLAVAHMMPSMLAPTVLALCVQSRSTTRFAPPGNPCVKLGALYAIRGTRGRGS